ncbi:unnamed protein product, partial [marine sediment metagenome]
MYDPKYNSKTLVLSCLSFLEKTIDVLPLKPSISPGPDMPLEDPGPDE